MPNEKVILHIQATLELNAADFADIDQASLESLQNKRYEALETTLPVTLRRGRLPIRGTIRFRSPEPNELKLARLKMGKQD